MIFLIIANACDIEMIILDEIIGLYNEGILAESNQIILLRLFFMIAIIKLA